MSFRPFRAGGGRAWVRVEERGENAMVMMTTRRVKLFMMVFECGD